MSERVLTGLCLWIWQPKLSSTRVAYLSPPQTMARTEADKEDLIADATAMLPRAEYVAVDQPESSIAWEFVTVGIRRDGAVSIYLDQDPFYQFDATGGLRRAYVGGFLFRSSSEGLTRLNRARTSEQTTLESVDLNADQLTDFRERTFSELATLQRSWRSGSLRKNRSVPEDADPATQLSEFVAGILSRSPAEFLSAPISPR